MQGVLKKSNDKDYINSHTSVDEKKEHDAYHKREMPKLDKYMSVIGQLLHVNSSMSNVAHAVNDNIDSYKDKRKIQMNNKTNTNEIQEQKFSIVHLKEKSENFETHKKGFFIITDELDEEEDDMSMKLKREILVSKLMYDRSIIIDKQLQSSVYDSAVASVYLGLSNESRRVLHDNNYDNEEEYNKFHNLIGFNKENTNTSTFQINNENIMNLCSKLLKFDDLLNIGDPEVNPITSLNSNIFLETQKKFSLVIPQAEKFVVEEEKVEPKSVDIKREHQVQFLPNSVIDRDEDFDQAEFNYFTNFLKESHDGAIKEKIGKFLDLIKGSNNSTSKLKLTNKMKNEILRNLKNEFLINLQDLENNQEDTQKENLIESVTLEKQIKEKEDNSVTIQVESKNISKIRVENPFEESLVNTASVNDPQPYKLNMKKNFSNNSVNRNESLDIIKGQMKTNLKNKIIITNQGWGVSDGVKKPALNLVTSSNLSTKRDERNLRTKSSPKQKLVINKIPNPKFTKLVNPKTSEGSRVIHSGNQRVIKSQKSLAQKSTGRKDEWLGNNAFDSDSSGEWVQQR